MATFIVISPEVAHAIERFVAYYPIRSHQSRGGRYRTYLGGKHTT
jgi:hypothetical protein